MTSNKKTKPKLQKELQSGPNATKSSKDIGLPGSSNTLPMASYISIVGVHTTLWSFVALFLPRTNFLGDLHNISQKDIQQQSSRDRPQHPFMEALTVDPTSTLLYICLGAVFLQSWWAGWVREWWLRLGIRGTDDEKRTEIAHLNRKKLSVRGFGFPIYFVARKNEARTGAIDIPRCLGSHLRGFPHYSPYPDFIWCSHHKVSQGYFCQ